MCIRDRLYSVRVTTRRCACTTDVDRGCGDVRGGSPDRSGELQLVFCVVQGWSGGDDVHDREARRYRFESDARGRKTRDDPHHMLLSIEFDGMPTFSPSRLTHRLATSCRQSSSSDSTEELSPSACCARGCPSVGCPAIDALVDDGVSAFGSKVCERTEPALERLCTRPPRYGLR